MKTRDAVILALLAWLLWPKSAQGEGRVRYVAWSEDEEGRGWFPVPLVAPPEPVEMPIMREMPPSA